MRLRWLNLSMCFPKEGMVAAVPYQKLVPTATLTPSQSQFLMRFVIIQLYAILLTGLPRPSICPYPPLGCGSNPTVG